MVHDTHLKDPNDGWQGRLTLRFTNVGGKTRPIKAHTTAPLRIQRPFYPTTAPHNCQSVIVHTAGGMVAGDRLDMAITAESNTQALITTAAAHKVYRSQGRWAEQSVHLKIGAGAYVEWMPQELILFNGGRLRHSIIVDLEPGGVCVVWDITRFGRSASGETLQTGQWRSQIEIQQQGLPLWVDRQQLTGGSEVLTSNNGLASYPVAGTFLLLGKSVSPEHLSAMSTLLGVQRSNRHDIGITRLEQGLVARYRGSSSQIARQQFTHIWQHLRTEVLNQKSYIPRVWGV